MWDCRVDVVATLRVNKAGCDMRWNHSTTTLSAPRCIFRRFWWRWCRGQTSAPRWGSHLTLIKAGCDMTGVRTWQPLCERQVWYAASKIALLEVKSHSPTRQKWLWYEWTTKHNHFYEWATDWLQTSLPRTQRSP